MKLEKYGNANLETEDDSFMKIFNKMNFAEEKKHSNNIVLDNDTSNTKIFIQVRSLSGQMGITRN